MEQHVPSRPGGPDRSLRVAVVLLVAVSGGVEAVSFLALDKVFAGVMTSNLALLGMAAGRSQAAGARAALPALGGFAAGLLAVALLTRRCAAHADRWPGRVVLVLGADALLLAVGAQAWGAAGGTPDPTTRDALQCGAALVMGSQSAAMVAAGRAAAPTTYLTGTLATFITRGVGTGRPGVWVPLRLAGLIAGAALSAGLLERARAWAALPPVLLTLAAVAAACVPLLRPGPPASDTR
ncbi:YoaK family protein [Streptomyces sp. NPDC001380]|uniref:YoaK family protein n=1 Tax=Streptomyces sp. NPDC001380 TaxID=3364566 RepID=UPI0036C81290